MVFSVRHSSYTNENTDSSYISFVVEMAERYYKSELEAWAAYNEGIKQEVGF
jgi:hypothetical protein